MHLQEFSQVDSITQPILKWPIYLKNIGPVCVSKRDYYKPGYRHIYILLLLYVYSLCVTWHTLKAEDNLCDSALLLGPSNLRLSAFTC